MPTLTEGQLVAGKYRVVRALGAGGMGTVYIAENLDLRRRVALKVLSRGVVRPQDVERFLREGIAASRVSHPNIVQVFDAGRHEGMPWLAMELLEGESLDRRVARGPLGLDEVLGVARGTLAALAAVHRMGIVHRDLKPANVFLARGIDGSITPKVLDFGVAKDTSANAPYTLTATGIVLGTPCYLSREQAMGLGELDARADVYAMGVMLYECLAGRLPYEASTVASLLLKILHDEPRHLSLAAPWVPEAVVAVVMRCLEPDRERRFPGAAELLEALEVAVAEAPSVQPPADPGPTLRAASVAGAAVVVRSGPAPASGPAPTSDPAAASGPAPAFGQGSRPPVRGASSSAPAPASTPPPGRATPATATTVALVDPAPADGSPIQTALPARVGPRRWWWAGGLAVLGLSAVAGTTAAVWSRQRASEAQARPSARAATRTPASVVSKVALPTGALPPEGAAVDGVQPDASSATGAAPAVEGASAEAEPDAEVTLLQPRPTRIFKRDAKQQEEFEWETLVGPEVVLAVRNPKRTVDGRVRLVAHFPDAPRRGSVLASWICGVTDCEVLVAPRSDGSALVRMENLAEGEDPGDARVLLLRWVPSLGRVDTVQQWRGTARDYWRGERPDWVEMRRP